MPETVKITINEKELKHFSGLSFVKTIDHVGDGFSFVSPFYPETKEYRDIFRPMKYQAVTIDVGGVRQFTGTLESISPKLSGSAATVDVQGRSRPGVIVDCSFEREDFPVQFTGATLEEISAQVLKPFNLTAVFAVPSGALFEEAGPQSATETVFNFLHNLARQRKLLIGQTAEGEVWFRQAVVTGRPVADLVEGAQGLVITGGDYDGTKRFSTFDVFGQEPGANDNYVQVVDPAITFKRPISKQANDTNSANIDVAAEWVASASVADSIVIPVGLEGWLKPDGNLWKENELITLYAPGIMVYKPFTFLIKSVSFSQGKDENTTELGLTIPGAYSGKLPKDYPWSE